MSRSQTLKICCLLFAVLLLVLTCNAQPVTEISASGAQGLHSLFIKGDGSLWSMGYNNDGQLGDGQYSNTNQPVQIVSSGVTAIAGGSSFSLFIKSDGSLWGVGQDYYGQLGDGYFTTSSPFGTNQPKQIVASGVAAVSAGYGHTLFVMTNGLSLIHISEPTRLGMISYAVFCL